ncbi:hypothetical protein [Kribbella deserti]|uniref:Uncharacterized protein n=1 Tax=Kribbella deserti TaxID=1926257 RepID=A0ABV6QV97_9ACTN
MATVKELHAQLTKVRQEVAKLTEILTALEPAKPPAKRTTAK